MDEIELRDEILEQLKPFVDGTPGPGDGPLLPLCWPAVSNRVSVGSLNPMIPCACLSSFPAGPPSSVFVPVRERAGAGGENGDCKQFKKRRKKKLGNRRRAEPTQEDTAEPDDNQGWSSLAILEAALRVP